MGYSITGESRLDCQSNPVCWQMRCVPTEPGGLTEAEAEAVANREAMAFGHHIPPWFRGRAYVIDSRGQVTTFLPPADAD